MSWQSEGLLIADFDLISSVFFPDETLGSFFERVADGVVGGPTEELGVSGTSLAWASLDVRRITRNFFLVNARYQSRYKMKDNDKKKLSLFHILTFFLSIDVVSDSKGR